MIEFEADTPIYYIIKPSVSKSEIEAIQHALRITPISKVIITSQDDLELAKQFSDEVLKVPTLFVAEETADSLLGPNEGGNNLPILIIGDVHFFEAHFADGHSEAISLEKKWDV